VVLGTLFVIAPAAETAALSDALHEAVADTDGVAAGATALPNDAGVLVRILGEAPEPVRVARRDGWRAARAELLDAPIPGRA
jgi:urease accessory protein